MKRQDTTRAMARLSLVCTSKGQICSQRPRLLCSALIDAHLAQLTSEVLGVRAWSRLRLDSETLLVAGADLALVESGGAQTLSQTRAQMSGRMDLSTVPVLIDIPDTIPTATVARRPFKNLNCRLASKAYTWRTRRRRCRPSAATERHSTWLSIIGVHSAVSQCIVSFPYLVVAHGHGCATTTDSSRSASPRWWDSVAQKLQT